MRRLALLALAACSSPATTAPAPPNNTAAYDAAIASDQLNSALTRLFASGGRAVLYMVVVDSATPPMIIVQVTKRPQ